MTDAVRTPDPVKDLNALAPHTLVIFRHYEAEDRESLGRRLRAIAKRRRLLFLVAGDWRLARHLRADGIHLPEYMVSRRGRFAPLPFQWLVTAAAHGPAGARRAQKNGADIILLSPVFPTASHPQRRSLGVLRLATTVNRLNCGVLALAGVSSANAGRAMKTGAVGIAGISGIVCLSNDPFALRTRYS